MRGVAGPATRSASPGFLPDVGRAREQGRHGEASLGPMSSVSRDRDTRPQQIGKFVYHCHIVGHEDKGMRMMATVEVVR
jgi:FtsP/CotA-like multicopper oxidase with cupredoxin domain